MEEIKRELKISLQEFNSISLKETSSIQLMNRYDTKYTFPYGKLETILEECRNDYRITTEKGMNLFPYETLYYDTPDRKLYTAHHNGHAHRYKFRIRSYVGFDLIFAEIKEKFKGKTLKQRELFSGFSTIGDCLKAPSTIEKIDSLICEHTPYKFSDFEETLLVNFHRITLVHTNKEERITIDTMLEYADGERCLSLPNLVIAEIKHQGPVPHLGFSQILKKQAIRAGSFSKYCIGSVSLNKNLKYNRFKNHILRIERSAL